MAREFLERSGYEILAQNYRSRYGEIDIIAARGELTAFIEVKTRNSRRHGEPFEAVGPRKQEQIKRMALMWLAVNESQAASATRSFRFDVVSINMEPTGPRIKHLPDAFR
jgi:putative endonuclease